MAVTQTVAQVNSDVPPKDIRVTLLGTASGPRAFVDKAGIGTLVEAGGERFLFDAGRGFMQRLVQAGFPMNAVSKLFLTHLHSDHVIGVPDLMLTPWSTCRVHLSRCRGVVGAPPRESECERTDA